MTQPAAEPDPAPADPAGATSPDPMPDPADLAGQRLRHWVRGIMGLIILAALITVVARGLYVVWTVTRP